MSKLNVFVRLLITCQKIVDHVSKPSFDILGETQAYELKPFAPRTPHRVVASSVFNGQAIAIRVFAPSFDLGLLALHRPRLPRLSQSNDEEELELSCAD